MSFRNAIVNSTILILACMAIAAGAQDASSQSPAKPAAEPSQSGNPYRLDFTLSEIESGKKINGRSYSMIAIGDGMKASLKLGKRVPVETGSAPDAKVTQFQYLDVGTSIDCRVHEVQGAVLLTIWADFSSIASEQALNPAVNGAPVIARINSDTTALAELGKPIVVAKMDDPTSKRTFELEVVATRLR
jgi:type II secretory pathway component GspD/PulD (secretin)